MKYFSCLEKIKNGIEKIDSGLSLIERDMLLEQIRTLYEAVSDITPRREQSAATQPSEEAKEAALTESTIAAAAEKTTERDIFEITPLVKKDILSTLYGDSPETVTPVTVCGAPADKAQSETISQGSMVFNKTAAPVSDIVSRLSSRGAPSIKNSIGLSDRFMIINELFAGEISMYERSIDELDSFTDINDAYIYMQENFGDKSDSRAFGLLVGLMERKLS